MNELIEFLSSKEIMVVYVVAVAACLLCLIIYIVEKNNEKLKRRQNTKELNKLVEEISNEVIPSGEEPITSLASSDKITEAVNNIVQKEPTIEVLDSTKEMPKVSQLKEEVIFEEPQLTKISNEEISKEANINIEKEETVIKNELKAQEKNLVYTSIEPDQETAKLELEKLTNELKRQELEKDEIENISLTNYEEEQEENAIISLEELIKKSKEMYAANELSQYKDEGNEPISLKDLERQMTNQKLPSYDEPFIIENVIETAPEEEATLTIEKAPEKVVLDDLNTVNIKSNQETQNSFAKKFQSSPIISPIYGIEKPLSSNEMQLENTANYDKLDEEIKKTNEFIMTLKELQKKLD